MQNCLLCELLQCLIERGIDCVATGQVHIYGVSYVLHICVNLGSQGKKKMGPVIQAVPVAHHTQTLTLSKDMWETCSVWSHIH